MRKFKLINARGDTWDLNDGSSFFNDPKGLGQEHKNEYEQIGTRFMLLKNVLKQKSISGKINFSGYKEYHDFSLFIQHTPLTLEYESYEKIYADIVIEKLEKTELSTGWIVCPIKISGLTTFYKMARSENSGDGNTGKIYRYSYPYKYADYSTGAVEIESDSAIVCPARLTIIGPCTNPSWTHYLNGIVKTTGKVNCVIPDGHRLVVDDMKTPFEIAEYDSTGTFVQSLYQESDFSTERFVFIGFGNNKISFSHEGDTVLSLIAEGRIEYETL